MKSQPVLIAPSILSADFSQLGIEAQRVQDAGADWIHVDVMDGHFVPNLTLGPVVVEGLRKSTSLPLDVHLMVEQPEKFVEPFAKAGADHLTVHYEVFSKRISDLLKIFETIRRLKMKVGLSINPTTDVEVIRPYIKNIDLILVMSVHPGFAGQAFVDSAVAKIEQLKSWKNHDGHPIKIVVDGGINLKTAVACRAAGVDVLVAGSAIFKKPDYAKAIFEIRGR